MQSTIVADHRGVLGWIVSHANGETEAYSNDGECMGTFSTRASAIAEVRGPDRYWAFDRAAVN